MRTARMSVAAMLGCVSFPVSAQVSSDLAFCSRLPQQRERLACYDAAARIAEAKPRSRPQPPRSVPAIASAGGAYASKAPIAANHIARSPFQGSYGTLGASYGLTQSISGPAPTFERVQPQGPSIVASAGYNHQLGAFVMGVEGSGRYGWERSTASARETYSSSQFPEDAGGQTNTTRFYSDASAHLSARFGVAVHNTLIFARAGFGIAHLETRKDHEAFGVRCTMGTSNGCLATGPALASLPFRESLWHPSALFGVGVEQNFGRFFGRLSGEGEAIYSVANSEPFWITRAKAELGVRF